MRLNLRNLGSSCPIRWLLPAVVSLVLIGSGEVAAGSSSRTHQCGCGTACRGSSCCCPHGEHEGETPPIRPVSTPRVEPPSPASPCLNAAPCGGSPGLPPSTPTGLSGKVALHGLPLVRAPRGAGPFFAALSPRLHSPPFPSRPARPPRGRN